MSLRREWVDLVFFVRYVGEVSIGESKIQKFSVPASPNDLSVVADTLPSQQKNKQRQKMAFGLRDSLPSFLSL